VNEFLIRWLAYHILHMDKSMVRQFNLIKEGGLSPSEAYEKDVTFVETSTEPLLKALRALFNLVSEKNKELEKKNQELEKKVLIRTHALEMASDKLERISIQDELTKLPNRRFVMMTIEEQMNIFTRYHTPFSILFIDVDKFKSVNDTYGHECGDQVLKRIAELLKTSTRKADYACRIGGDEFIVICPNTSAEEALVLAKKLNETCSNIALKNHLEFWNPSISIGVTMINNKIDSASDLLKKAYAAMYEAKKTGGTACIA
jgi:hemerythrin